MWTNKKLQGKAEAMREITGRKICVVALHSIFILFFVLLINHHHIFIVSLFC
jgi:hypothetical protein